MEPALTIMSLFFPNNACKIFPEQSTGHCTILPTAQQPQQDFTTEKPVNQGQEVTCKEEVLGEKVSEYSCMEFRMSGFLQCNIEFSGCQDTKGLSCEGAADPEGVISPFTSGAATPTKPSFGLGKTDRKKKKNTKTKTKTETTTIYKEGRRIVKAIRPHSIPEASLTTNSGFFFSPDEYTYRGHKNEKIPNNIRVLHFADDVTEIAHEAFSGLPIEIIPSFPPNLTSIKSSAFSDCSKLTKLPPFPKSLTKIGDEAFFGCGLTEIPSFPTSLTTIGVRVFEKCKSLKKITSFPPALTTIGEGAFEGCGALEVIPCFPSTLQTIGVSAFANCKSLATIRSSFPPNLSLGNRAFAFCGELRNVSLASTIIATPIGKPAALEKLRNKGTLAGSFVGCTALLKLSKNAKMEIVPFLRHKFTYPKYVMLMAVEHLTILEGEARKKGGKRMEIERDVIIEDGYLNGRLAFDMITDVHVWRYIAEFL